jgi:hypothetical protein
LHQSSVAWSLVLRPPSMRYICSPAPISVGASRYWSSGPVPAAEGPPAAGAVGVVGGCDAGTDEVGGAEGDVDGTGEAGAEVVADGCGLLDVAGVAAADRES